MSPKVNFTLSLDNRPAKSWSQNSNTMQKVDRYPLCCVPGKDNTNYIYNARSNISLSFLIKQGKQAYKKKYNGTKC
jgi:hypothetical protein